MTDTANITHLERNSSHDAAFSAEAEQIAREVLAERRTQVFDAAEISEIRAEVKRRVALAWQRAA